MLLRRLRKCWSPLYGRYILLAFALAMPFYFLYLYVLSLESFLPQEPEQQESYCLQAKNGDSDKEIVRLLELCHQGDTVQEPFMMTKSAVVGGPFVRQIYLETCFPIEIGTSQGGRSMGHCSDFVQYVFYAGARLSPEYDEETYRIKARKCPHSIYLHGEYPIPTLFAAGVRNYWMPNAEQMRKDQADLVPLTDTFIAKTKATHDALVAYLEGSEISGPRVLHIGHSSPDPRVDVPMVKPDFNKFYHAYGLSGLKSNFQLVECWKRHPEWPTLHVIGHHAVHDYPFLKGNQTENIKILGSLPITDLRRIQYESGVHICPSRREGFGHYINEARALGALVITTNFTPMNEFIEHGKSGILINHDKPYSDPNALLGKFWDLEVNVTPDHICKAISMVLDLSDSRRRAMGQVARIKYLNDRDIMIEDLSKLKKESYVEYHAAKSWPFGFLMQRMSLKDIEVSYDEMNGVLMQKCLQFSYRSL